MLLPILIALSACAAFAQAPADSPAFEVASVKASAPGGRGMSLQRGVGGRFTTENVPLKMLITFAYDIRDHQLSGGPGWMNDDRFDIAAKPDRDIPSGDAGNQTIRLMVQSMLAERFHLVVHRETREMPIYALVIAKGGPKMTEAAPESRGSGFRMKGRGQMTVTKAKMEMFVRVLSNQVGRTVVDKTGLTADYDFKLEYAPDMAQPLVGKDGVPAGVSNVEKGDAPNAPDLPSLFTALQEQLGLRLEPQKGPVEIVVVDRAEKPSEN